MLVQCRPLFMGETARLPLDAELDFTQVEYQGMLPFRQPVRVRGEIAVHGGVVLLKAVAELVFDGRCDRCLTPFSRPYSIPMEHVLVSEIENEDSDYVLLQDYHLPLDELVQADVMLELPYKSLCRGDCRGLCPHCGKNLNEGLCGCRPDTTDPRLAVLKQLLN